MSRKHTLVGTLSVALAGAAIFGVGLSACDHACTSCDHDEPAAAYDLTAEIGEGGVLLTWEDASEIEDSYVVQRRDEDEDHFRELARLDEDAVEYLDADVKDMKVARPAGLGSCTAATCPSGRPESSCTESPSRSAW